MDLLNLPNWRVLDRTEPDGDYLITAEYTVKPGKCLYPDCRSTSISRNGSRPASFRDLPMHGKRVIIKIERQRYICSSCGKSFTQPLPDISTRRDATNRFVTYVGEKSRHLSFAAVADDVGVAENMVKGIFVEYARELEKMHPLQTPTRLGIDEIHISKKFHCVLSNVEENTVFDFLDSRWKKTVARRMSKIKPGDVEVITIDMSRNFRDVAAANLPGAAIVIDKFHVTRMMDEALTSVRIEEGRTLSNEEKKQMMQNKELFTTHRKNLKNKFDEMVLDTWLERLPLLKDAYWVKEDFYSIYDSYDRFEAKSRYKCWQSDIPASVKPFFAESVNSLENWEKEIFAYFDCQPRLTNAFTESLNSLIRHINRNGRGYSFDVLRAKILYGTDATKYRRGVFKRPATKTKMKTKMKTNIDSFSRMMSSEPKAESKAPLFYLGADIKRLIELYESGEL